MPPGQHRGDHEAADRDPQPGQLGHDGHAGRVDPHLLGGLPQRGRGRVRRRPGRWRRRGTPAGRRGCAGCGPLQDQHVRPAGLLAKQDQHRAGPATVARRAAGRVKSAARADAHPVRSGSHQPLAARSLDRHLQVLGDQPGAARASSSGRLVDVRRSGLARRRTRSTGSRRERRGQSFVRGPTGTGSDAQVSASAAAAAEVAGHHPDHLDRPSAPVGETLQHRQLLPARRAPGRPQVHHRRAAQLGPGHRLAVGEAGQVSVGQRASGGRAGGRRRPGRRSRPPGRSRRWRAARRRLRPAARPGGRPTGEPIAGRPAAAAEPQRAGAAHGRLSPPGSAGTSAASSATRGPLSSLTAVPGRSGRCRTRGTSAPACRRRRPACGRGRPGARGR